jgi:tryptophan 2,3-dioxygenase
MPLTRSPVTYSSYLKLDELLSLQRPLSDGPEHDEMLFIIVHQVYELWFKEILHELDYLQNLLARSDTPRALHTLKRILTILKVLVSQLDILETMTPLEFLSFRDRLESGSGFQSFQFRELEFALALKQGGTVERYPEGSEARRRLAARYAQPTLWDSFLHYLVRNGYDVPHEELARDAAKPVEPSPDVQRVLIEVYRRNPMLTQICERLVDLDEGVQEWRYRHVKMVQRTIGTKAGTGGSAGAEYLATTLSKPLFPDLWAIRTEL